MKALLPYALTESMVFYVCYRLYARQIQRVGVVLRLYLSADGNMWFDEAPLERSARIVTTPRSSSTVGFLLAL